MDSSSIFYPNVTSLLPVVPSRESVSRIQTGRDGANSATGVDFEKTLTEAMNLDQVRIPLKFSHHAMQRMADRKIQLDRETLARVSDAVEKADAKGVQDTLILTPQAALIVNVKNKTVVTAMDRSMLMGNVFTNIDGAVLV